MNGMYEDLRQDSWFAIEVAETARRFRGVLDSTFGTVPGSMIAEHSEESSAVDSLFAGMRSSSNGCSPLSQSLVTTDWRTGSAAETCEKYEILHWIEW